MLLKIDAATTHVFAGQHEQPVSAWTWAKHYFPVNPAVIEYLVSRSKRPKGNSDSGCTIPMLAIGTETDMLARLVPLQHPRLRETVLKSLSLLE